MIFSPILKLYSWLRTCKNKTKFKLRDKMCLFARFAWKNSKVTMGFSFWATALMSFTRNAWLNTCAFVFKMENISFHVRLIVANWNYSNKIFTICLAKRNWTSTFNLLLITLWKPKLTCLGVQPLTVALYSNMMKREIKITNSNARCARRVTV